MCLLQQLLFNRFVKQFKKCFLWFQITARWKGWFNNNSKKDCSFFFFFCHFAYGVKRFTIVKVWKALTSRVEGRRRSSCRTSCQTEPMWLQREWLVLFQPRWTVPTWHFQLDVELLECLFQLLLVSSVVRSYGVVEQDELVVQYLHLFGSRKQEKGNKDMVSTLERNTILLVRLCGAGQASSLTLFSSRNFSLTETSFRILSYFSRWIWNCCWEFSILGMVVASRGPRFNSSRSVRYASYSTLEVWYHLNSIRNKSHTDKCIHYDV